MMTHCYKKLLTYSQKRLHCLFVIVVVFCLFCTDAFIIIPPLLRKTLSHSTFASRLTQAPLPAILSMQSSSKSVSGDNDNTYKTKEENKYKKFIMLQYKTGKSISFLLSLIFVRCGYILIHLLFHMILETESYQNATLAAEKLPYDRNSRSLATNEIVDLMTRRHNDRVADTNNPDDKTHNFVIVIPGSPGIGTSTFMQHFPESEEYLTYVKEKYAGKEVKPIVIPVTFNSGWDSFPTSESFPTRMLYGAALAMGGLKKAEMDWEEFYDKLHGVADSKNVIDIIKDVYGKDRPILLLVDELSKLKSDKESENVMSLIGRYLDKNGELDCIVSSLSIEYVESLTTKSNRELVYVLLPTLSNSNVGSEANRKFLEQFASKHSEKGKEIFALKERDKFMFNLLHHLHLIVGDYPRNLQRLFEDKKHALAELLLNTDFTKPKQNAVTKFIKRLVPKSLTRNVIKKPKGNKQIEDVLEFIFGREDLDGVENPTLREFVEIPNLFVYPIQGSSSYKPALTVDMFLGLCSDDITTTNSVSIGSRYAKQVQMLFGKYAGQTFSNLFERCVRQSIAIDAITAEDRFGVDLEDIPHTDLCDVILTSNEATMFQAIQKATKETDIATTIEAYPHCAGFDGITVYGDTFVYDQCKSSKPGDRDRPIHETEIRMKALVYSLDMHLNIMESIANEKIVSEEEIKKAVSTFYFVNYLYYDSPPKYSADDMRKSFEQYRNESQTTRESNSSENKGTGTIPNNHISFFLS